MISGIMSFTRQEKARILRFAIVGLAATVTHAGMVLLLVEGSGMAPLRANFFSFLLAVLVSFAGHYHWTFTATTTYARAFPRFFTIALLGLGVSQAMMFSTVFLLGLHHRLSLAAVVMVVPAINFLANRFWTFQPVPD